jgi:hypothetical protein
MSAILGRSLELFFIDGKPDGMLTAEVFNWTGHVLMTPRTQISDALRRKEARYTGVYLLFGERDGEPLAYIGEGEDISDRIRNHEARKDWWTTAVLVTASANNLNKAHVKYLEARLVEEARAIGRIQLENGNTPARASLSEAAQANMESFLDYLLLVLPALRIDSFVRNLRPSVSSVGAPLGEAGGSEFEIVSKKHGLTAQAVLVGGDFIVQAGSQARSAWEGVGSKHTSYAELHDELTRNGVLQLVNDHRVFSSSYAFSSPSAAAAVVLGRPANGTIEWKLRGQNVTYKEWEARELTAEDFTGTEPTPITRSKLTQ